MKHFLSFSVLVSLLFSFTSPALALVVKVPDTGTDTKVCIQVIQNAKNSTTGECQAFSTPCDVPAGWTPVQKCSLPDAAKVVEPKFEVKKFNSCSELEDTLVNIFERYQSNYWSPYGPYMMKGGMALDMAVPVPTGSPVTNSVRAKGELTQSTIGDKGATPSTDPFSTTNIQVAGVDEADVVKTDGTNIYSYSESAHQIRIVRMSDMKLQKILSLPESFSSVEMYLSNGKLVLVGHKYISTGPYFFYRYYAPENKTVVAVYTVKDPTNLVLDRFNQIDGDYHDSRLIGSTLYLLSTNTLRVPPVYFAANQKGTDIEYQASLKKLRAEFALKYVVPQIREARSSSSTGKYTQSIRSSVASCSDITFVLPDDETMKHIDFSPSFVSLSSVDISSPTSKMQSQLLFGDVSQIHMSQNSLYITSTISQTTPTTSTDKNIAPWYGQYESSTLVHRYALNNGMLTYKYTTKLPGNPMNQYSMDEDGQGNFRIVTQKYSWSSGTSKNETELSVLSPEGKVIGSLTGIAPGENFQSARFIGDRLYLVTFQQIDPLFVIDLSTPTAPRILGELKMPGYSTYLHPYDKDRLIGLGYDTFTNKYGGTQNSGLKIDLYNVADVKNPKQEGTLTLGDNGSSSEVLTNPRAFVWYKEKNLLLLPAQIQYSAHDPVDTYRAKSIYQGLIGLSIVPGSVTEKFRVTHILPPSDLVKEWKTSCEPYLGKSNNNQTCRKLLDGSQYCTTEYNYVPQYCYADSTAESYMASNFWNYSSDYITRSLYRGENFFTLSDSSMKSWSFADTKNATAVAKFDQNGNSKNPRIPTILR